MLTTSESVVQEGDESSELDAALDAFDPLAYR
jgi:hypothetical protein